MNFAQIEAESGVRFTWNKLPRTKIDQQKEVIPLSMLLTPFYNPITEIPIIERDPIRCDKCKWIISNLNIFDYSQLSFKCIQCSHLQKLPTNLQREIQNGYIMPEFQTRHSVFEYVNSEPNMRYKPLLMINIDLCTTKEEFVFIRTNLLKQIEGLKECYVSLTTFNHNVMIHDLQNPSLFQSVLAGNKHYKPEQVIELLRLKAQDPLKFVENQYIQSIDNCRDKLLEIIWRLKSCQFDVKKNNWVLREFGLSLVINAALSMSFGGMGGRLLNFLSGPGTKGMGMIIEQSLQKTFRDYEELDNNTESIYMYQKAYDFYSNLAPYFNKYFMCFDLFGFCLTQFGLSEMRTLIQKTNGIVINDEEFNNEFFEQNFEKYFNSILSQSSIYGCLMTINYSQELYLGGAIGFCALKEKILNFANEGDQFFGEFGGNEYILGSPTKTNSVLLFFGLNKPEVDKSQKQANIQIQIRYYNWQGFLSLRVFTFSRDFSDDLQIRQSYFDQETAIATIAWMTALKGEKLQVQDITYWLNNLIIKLIKQFSIFTPGDITSFKLSPQIDQIIQFMFFFRKSYFVQRIGVSLDEQALYKMALYRENLANTLCMIQPTVYQYSLDSDPVPVSCELEQLKPEAVLLLDTYYYILIWHGQTIHSWIKEGYHLQPEYEHLKNMLDAPEEDAQIILEDRYPVSKLIKCHQGSPMERILKSKLNPNQAKSNADKTENENYITDDVSMKKFQDHIISIIVDIKSQS